MGVPGYEGGIDSVPDANLDEFERLRAREIDAMQKTTRGATTSFRNAHANVPYHSGADMELDEFEKIYREQAAIDGVPQDNIERSVK
jgi:hypothetical protein